MLTHLAFCFVQGIFDGLLLSFALPKLFSQCSVLCRKLIRLLLELLLLLFYTSVESQRKHFSISSTIFTPTPSHSAPVSTVEPG